METKKGWTTTKLLAAGSLGVLELILRLLGTGINALTGTVGASVINTLIGSAIVIICLFVVEKFGAVSIMYAVFGVLALPFYISGVPGFLPKIPIMIIGGILIDTLFYFLKLKNQLISFAIGGIRTLYVGISVIEVGRLFGIPGIEISAKFLYSPIGMTSAFILGGIGGFIGWLIYQKIKDSFIIKRIHT